MNKKGKFTTSIELQSDWEEGSEGTLSTPSQADAYGISFSQPF